MSLFSGSNISELFVGESKIGSVFVGENCVYQSNYEIPIEEDNGDEYFYFRVHDKRETAQVGDETRTSRTNEWNSGCESEGSHSNSFK